MIQRVQTLFLLAITALSVMLIFMPFLMLTGAGPIYRLCLSPACLQEGVAGTIHIPMALNVIVLILSAITIFLYKKRKLQVKMCQFILVLSTLLLGSMFMFSFIKTEGADLDFTIVSFFPALNIIFAFFARLFIKKDEELVRSADRIR